MASSDYETQGMALKLKELDEELKKYGTKTYPCESHLTWCCDGEAPVAVSEEGKRLGHEHFDNVGRCTNTATHRVLLLDAEEEKSTGVARKGQPTLCVNCVQIVIDHRCFREIITTQKADQMEQDFAASRS